ncbi:MAG TPA: DUF4783 domain-containing protein [Ignavibacteria bacterium]|nr:DUF4783 domain-containing protein [Ignavibacteria bacterium]HMR00108.1 DUF4783 domain-containing protein [Ignavibacteria bacterium]
MGKITIYLLSVFYVIAISCGDAYSQDSWWKEKKYKSEDKQKKFENCKHVFLSIADGLMYSNVTYISPFFQNEIYLSLQDSEKGYYNREQSGYIIENFLQSFPVSSFKWKNSSRSERYAFALGKYKYKKGGFISTFTISVSLKYLNDLWLIDQVIVN